MEAEGGGSYSVFRVDDKSDPKENQQYKEDLQEILDEASKEDGCMFYLRVYLANVWGTEEDSDEIRRKNGFFLARYTPPTTTTTPTTPTTSKIVGFLFAYPEKDADPPTVDITPAIVHPRHRRRGVLKLLIEAAREEYRKDDYEIFNFTIFDESHSGVTSATHLGCTRVDNLDQYLECHSVLPPSSEKFPVKKVELELTEDADEIFDVWNEEEKYTEEEAKETLKMIQKGFEKRGHRCYILRNPENIESKKSIGTVSLVDSKEDDSVYFLNVNVRPEFRRLGWGEAMVREATRICVEVQKRSYVSLETPNPEASRLYQRVGYVVKHTLHDWTLKI